MGSPKPGRTHSRLAAGGLVEAAAEDEVAQLVVLRGCEGVWQSRQNVDVVEAVPLPHGIHPGGVGLIEAVGFVLVTLHTGTRASEGQLQGAGSRAGSRSRNEWSGVVRSDRQGWRARS